MKIITKAFFDGKFISKEEKSGYLDRFPDSLEISKTINELNRNPDNNWGYILLISDSGISTSPITIDDLTIEY